MRRLILTGALATLVVAAPAAAKTLNFTCQGYAEDAAGGRLAALLQVDAAGTLGDLTSTWMPPAKASPLVKGTAVYDAELAVTAPGEALLTVSALAPPGARATPATLYRDLDGLRLVVSIDGAAPQVLGYANDLVTDDLPLTANRTARLALPESARSVVAELRNAKGVVVRSVHFDLSDGAARQRLLDTAGAEARRAAASYQTCEKIG